MDFEAASQRLARDQQKLRGRKTMVVSAKAKREADYKKKQQEQKRHERLQQQKQRDFIQQFMTACDRSLGVKSLAPAVATSAAATTTGGLQLSATSIHGEGDKIALPPSVLERLTQSMAADDSTSSSSPWLFRIGILNPEYQFPASVLLKTLKPANDDDDDDDTMQDDSIEDNSTTSSSSKAAYLDELGHKYISYTHGTVVEFTQDEGHVGLPAPMAAALLNPKRRLAEHASYEIPVTRTLDPSKATSTDTPKPSKDDDEEENDVAMDGTDGKQEGEDDEDMTKTPGHVAYGEFDIPDMPVEITMLRLPKGKGCTLTPTHEAIRNGFYNLQDVKLVLEQSLIRTRATLSVGDTVQTWHRGVSYDLLVSKVIPPTYHAITCINTDIEVELGEVKDFPEDKESFSAKTSTTTTATTTTTAPESTGLTLSGGRVLSAPSPLASPTTPVTETTKLQALTADLIPEPPMDQKEGICTVQLRAEGIAPARRRFDVQVATLQDLFDFARSFLQSNKSDTAATFRLVTRFPRNVFELNDENKKTVLTEAGIQSGQHLMMVEGI